MSWMGSLIMPMPLFQSSSLGLGAPLFWRPLESQRSRCMAEIRGVFKHNILDSSFSSTFSYCFFFVFWQSVWYGCLDVFVMGLSWLLGCICFCFV